MLRCGVAPIKWARYNTDVECTKPEKFGMYHGKPCMMIKLNKVYGWEPEPYYNITEVGVCLGYVPCCVGEGLCLDHGAA